MVTQFLIAHFLPFIGVGALVSIISGFWLMFAEYEADVSLARKAHYCNPMLTYKIVLEHPDICLKPFIVNCVGALIFAAGLFGAFMKISTISRF